MSYFDSAVLIFYFVFMVAISWVFRRFVHNVSDYLRGGGKVVWWIVGGSAFKVTFSAWTFTGAASLAYEEGWPIVVIYFANALGFLVSGFYFAPRFRQMRAITSVETIRQRFGRLNEQIFTWLQIPLGTLLAGVWLNAVGVFFSAVFGLDLSFTIVGTGIVVLLIALIGGSWAVLASDFIQLLILMPVCVVVTVLAIVRVGGVHQFFAALPPAHLDLGRVFSNDFLALWCVAMLLKQFSVTNNLLDANRYLAAKDSRHARWAAHLAAALFALSVVIWFVPPLAAKILFPQLGAIFPQLRNPGEAAFIAVSREVLPVGMIGLLVSGIFAATMSSMDLGLNKNAGIFVKNFYQPHFRPDASETRLLAVAKIATVALGVVIVFVALEISARRELGLFHLMQRVSILIGTPIIVPLLLGMIVRRTPPWSAWSTVLVGFAGSIFIQRWMTPEWAAQVFGVTGPLNPAAAEYWIEASQFLGNAILGSIWFLGTKLFWSGTTPAYRADVDAFFARLARPVDFTREEGPAAANDHEQLRSMGSLCLIYGAFVALLVFIPNPLAGRLAFLGCGGFVIAMGAWMIVAARPRALVNAETNREAAERGEIDLSANQALLRPSEWLLGSKVGAEPMPILGSERSTAARSAPALTPTGKPALLLAVLTPTERQEFFPEPLWTEMRTCAVDVQLVNPNDFGAERFAQTLSRIDPEVVVGCWKTPSFPDTLPSRLRYVCYLAGSVKRLNLKTHIERGLLLSNWGNSISAVVAEGALFQILSCLRRGPEWNIGMHQRGAWKDETTQTASLLGRKVGLHGFGKVARELVGLLRPFSAQVSVFAPDVTPAAERDWGVRRAASLDALFAENDVVVEVAPLIPETFRSVQERHLRLLRPGCVFVNVGRGDVVDEDALIRVAKEGKVMFGLDVFSVEPLPPDHPLRGLLNVSLTPHLAGPTNDRRADAGAWALRNLRAYAAGQPLAGQITAGNYEACS